MYYERSLYYTIMNIVTAPGQVYFLWEGDML